MCRTIPSDLGSIGVNLYDSGLRRDLVAISSTEIPVDSEGKNDVCVGHGSRALIVAQQRVTVGQRSTGAAIRICRRLEDLSELGEAVLSA